MAVTAGSEPPVEAGTGQLLAHLRSVLPGLAGAQPSAPCWQFLSAIGVSRSSALAN